MKKILIYSILLLLRGFVFLAGKILFRLRVSGFENLPTDRGAILVINHGSYIDFLIAACILPGKFSFIINSHVYHRKGIHWLLKAANCIPVGSGLDPEARTKFNESVQEQLNLGHYVCLFAEGTVTRTGQILEFKKGIEHLAEMSDSPIIPVHFDNVVGAPFSWQPGAGKLFSFRLKGIRRPVYVAMGKELRRPLTAFQLRQKVKELEAENFKKRFKPSESLSSLLLKKISGKTQGMWAQGADTIPYKDLLFSISSLSQTLQSEIKEDAAVGILLPGSLLSMQINFFLLIQKKTIVNIDPSLSNEERLFVCNTAGIRTVITTRDQFFSRSSPVSERVIYIEDIETAAKDGKEVKPCMASLSAAGRQFRAWLRGGNERERVVSIFYEKNLEGELKGIPLTNMNLMAVLAGIKQSHFFDRSMKIYADLPMHHSFGFVLQFLLPLYFDLTWKQNLETNEYEEKGSRLFLLTKKQQQTLSTSGFNSRLHEGDRIFSTGIFNSESTDKSYFEKGAAVLVCGGMNETSSVFSLSLHNYVGTDIEGKILEHASSEQGSIGKALPGICVKISNDTKGEFEEEPDISGAIWVRGAAVMTEYINTEETTGCFISDGWLRTGLRGYVNSKGFIYVVNS